MPSQLPEGGGAVRYQDPLRLGLLTVVLERAFAKFEGSGFRNGCLALFGLKGLKRHASEKLPSTTVAPNSGTAPPSWSPRRHVAWQLLVGPDMTIHRAKATVSVYSSSPCLCHSSLLGGSWVVLSRDISRVTVVITHIGGLITLLIPTHEPPSRIPPAELQGMIHR